MISLRHYGSFASQIFPLIRGFPLVSIKNNLSLVIVDTLLEIKDLSLTITGKAGDLPILKAVSMVVHAGEKVGLIGESGSGKSMLARTILGLNPHIDGLSLQGQVLWHSDNQTIDLLEDSGELPLIRRNEIGIVFQQSAQVFNPSQTIGVQLREKSKDPSMNDLRIEAALEEVELSPGVRFYKAYPHQLSGGQLQRALIALALINGPKLLIADEPLSALDNDTQTQILNLLKRIVEDRATSLLIISHDLQHVFELCDSLVVLEEGVVVEHGEISEVLRNPQGKLTTAFTSSETQPAKPSSTNSDFDVLIRVKEASLSYKDQSSFFIKQKEGLVVFDKFNLSIRRGEILGLYGRSGSGKSTLARMLLRLEALNSGSIYFKDRNIHEYNKAELKTFRREAQIIFQDPFSSMSPHRNVRAHFVDAARAMGKQISEERIKQCLLEVGLNPAFLSRIPKQLSGGERQRVLIARAIYMDVEFLVCDEILASLDVIVSEGILKLLESLVKQRGLTTLFISHDLTVLKKICDRVVSLDTEQNSA